MECVLLLSLFPSLFVESKSAIARFNNAGGVSGHVEFEEDEHVGWLSLDVSLNLPDVAQGYAWQV